MMLNPFDLDEQDRDIIVDSILDWRDADDLYRLNGAENEYYESLTYPYGTKNKCCLAAYERYPWRRR